jgi:predicted O-methyltransferase YrrM
VALKRQFLPRPQADHVATVVARSHRRSDAGLEYYDGVVVGASVLGRRATDPRTRAAAARILDRLEGDDYLGYVRDFVQAGERLVGEDWRYADITTVLVSAAELLAPRAYLEIGVRRGRSMALVAATAPDCAITGIDMWIDDYAGMENPGPDHVRAELAKVGHRGEVEFIEGDSHSVLPALFRDRPELSFDLITVDGDHSPKGASQDLSDVLPRLNVGGVLVFDDIRHRAHPELHGVWRSVVASDRRYATWEFDDIGYGVALAVRRW